MKNLADIQELQQYNNLEFIARHVVEGFITGMHRSPFHGFSVEFAEHRIYNQGESTKHIDWKLFAKTEKLFVKRYEEETNLRGHIIMDISSSMLFPYKDKLQNKLSYSIYCAAALIYLLRKQRDAVGLTLFSDKVEMHTEARLAGTHSQMLFGKLGELFESYDTLNKSTNTSEILHEIAENIHQRSLVIIFSDMIDKEDPEKLFSALQHLKYNKHDVIVFHVTDKSKEVDFNYENRPYRFVDMETGEEVKFNPNDVRDTYKTSVKEYLDELKIKCGQYSIDLVEADINSDFNEVLLPYLLKRKRLY